MSVFDRSYDDFNNALQIDPITSEDEILADFGETVSAAFGTTFRETHLFSEQMNRSEHAEKRKLTLEKLSGKKLGYFDVWEDMSHEGRERYNKFFDAGELFLDAQGEIGWTNPRAKMFYLRNRMATKAGLELRQFADRYPGEFKTDIEIDEIVKGELKEKRERDQAVINRTHGFWGGVAQFTGAAGAALTDPRVLATMPMGLGWLATSGKIGTNLLKAFGTESAIAAAVEVPIQHQAFEYKKRIESPYTAKEAALNVLAASLGAGIVRGGGSVTIDIAAKTLEKYRSGIKTGTIKPTSETEAAADVLEQYADEAGKIPLRERDRDAEAYHFEAINKAASDIEDGRVVDVSDLVRGYEPDIDEPILMPEALADRYIEDISRQLDPDQFDDVIARHEAALVEAERAAMDPDELKAIRAERNRLEQEKAVLENTTGRQANKAEIQALRQAFEARGMDAREAKRQARAEVEKTTLEKIEDLEGQIGKLDARLQRQANVKQARSALEQMKKAKEKRPVPRETKPKPSDTAFAGPVRQLPDEPEKFFNMEAEGAVSVPMDRLVPVRARPKGVLNANKFMMDAYEGTAAVRKPLDLKANKDGTFTVLDGNSTFANAARSGWSHIVGRVVEGPDVPTKESTTGLGIPEVDVEALGGEAVAMAPAVGREFRLRSAPLHLRPRIEKTFLQNQLDRDWDQVYVSAEIAQKELGQTGKKIEKKIQGVEFMDPGVKKRETAEERAADKGKTPGQMKDIVRAGFIARTPHDADRVVRELSRDFEVLDEGWAYTEQGYFDRKLQVRFDDGTVGEVQIWEPHLLEAKEDLGGHKLYEEARTLVKQTDDGVEYIDEARFNELVEQMTDLYAGALDKATHQWVPVVRDAKVLYENKELRIPGQVSSKSARDMRRPELATSTGLTGRQAPVSSLKAEAKTLPPSEKMTAGAESQLDKDLISATDIPPTKQPGEIIPEADKMSTPVTRVLSDDPISAARKEMDLIDDQDYDLTLTEAQTIIDEIDIDLPEQMVEGEMQMKGARQALDEITDQEKALQELATCKAG